MTAHDTITCPGCGGKRQVTHRQRRRANSEGGILCATCRGGSAVRRCSDADIRYWLEAYGSAPAPRTPVRQHIAAGGAPPELVALARSIFPR